MKHCAALVSSLKATLFFACGLTAIVVIFLKISSQRQPEPLGRENYLEYNFQKSRWLVLFMTEYEAAKLRQESWTKNPTEVALRVAGYPNPDNLEPDKVSVFRPRLDYITVIIMADLHMVNDSVWDSEQRIDLIKRGDIWEIDWAGGRYSCIPGRGQEELQPKLCR